MLDAVMRTVDAEVRPVADDDGPGEFEMVLSDDTEDRDGDRLFAYQWAHPLPESIPINTDHSRAVGDIVGSGEPFIDSDGSLKVRGTFASTHEAQRIRALVREGHVRSVSVNFCVAKTAPTS